jgi:hypothetical protein
MSESLEKKDPKNNYRTLFIRCDCHSSLISSKMSIWQKIRYIYQILKYGKPYTDQIILHKNQIDELKAFLNSL